MNIADLLKPSQVIVDLRAPDKKRALETLAQHAAPAVDLGSKVILTALLAREALGSTGMGDGTALPHARFPEIKRTHAVLARLKNAVDFDAIDGRPVDLVCLLLLPTGPQGEQLKALSSVARSFRDRDLLIRLRKASSADALYRALAEKPAG